MPFIIADGEGQGPEIMQLVRRSLEFQRQPSADAGQRRSKGDDREAAKGASRKSSVELGRRMSTGRGTSEQQSAENQTTNESIKRLSVDITRISQDTQRRRQNDAAQLANKGKKEGPAAPGGPSTHEEGEEGKVDFVQAPHDGLTSQKAAELIEKWGKNELPEKHTPKWLIFLRLLTGPMPIMLWIAALIEAIIENYADMGILLAIQFINAFISFYETNKAGDAVAALKKSLKPTATCKRDGKWADIDATMLGMCPCISFCVANLHPFCRCRLLSIYMHLPRCMFILVCLRSCLYVHTHSAGRSRPARCGLGSSCRQLCERGTDRSGSICHDWRIAGA